MEKKKKNGYYKNTMGSMKDMKGDYMMHEDLSEPSNMPRGAKSMKLPYVECGGQYVDDSLKYSDRDSDEMARKIKSDSPSSMF